MNCIICQQPMKLLKIIHNVKGVNTKFNMNKYKCPLCNYEETLASGGEGDIYRAELAIKDVKRMYKQEEINRQ